MNNTINTLTSIFTGKGSTLKLAIVGSLFAAIIYEIMDTHYDLNIMTKNGGISLEPASYASYKQTPVDLSQENKQTE